MKKRAALVLIAGLLLVGGCTRVAFRTPAGKPVDSKDQDELMGEWTGAKGIVWTVDRDPKSGFLRASWTADGKAQTRLLLLTTIGDTESLVWEKEDDLNAYVPLRIAGADEAVALLYPDEKKVKELVAGGTVSAAFDKGNNAWVFPDGDWVALLERADFWNLDASMPFVRTSLSKDAGKAPAPPSSGK